MNQMISHFSMTNQEINEIEVEFETVEYEKL